MFHDIKTIIVGDDGVGKTSLIITFTSEKFEEEHLDTTQDVYKKSILWRNETVSLNVYDTAGDPDYDQFRRRLYPDTKAFLLCFSLNDLNSFESVSKRWVPEIRTHASPTVPIILCGTCSDLERKVTQEEALRVKKELKLAAYVECSAKKKENLKNVFDTVIEMVIAPPKSKCSVM